MRFAELTTPRTLLALASATTLGLAVAALAPCAKPAVAVAKVPLTPMRACAERAAPPYYGPSAPRVGHGDAYRQVLSAQLPTLNTCLPEGTDGPIRLTLAIAADGQVREAELTEHGRRVADDELQTCVMAVVSGLAFPASPHPVTLTAHLLAPDEIVRR